MGKVHVVQNLNYTKNSKTKSMQTFYAGNERKEVTITSWY